MHIPFVLIRNMKLICETCVLNRKVPHQKKPFQNTILAIGKNNEKKSEEAVIMLITNANKGGTKYALKKNINKIFTRFISEGAKISHDWRGVLRWR